MSSEKVDIDRMGTVPFLLRLFYRTGSFHSTAEFLSQSNLPDHISIYTWTNCTLLELSAHLFSTPLSSHTQPIRSNPSASTHPGSAILPNPEVGSRLVFRLVYPDAKAVANANAPAKFITRDIGSVVVGGSERSVAKYDAIMDGTEDLYDYVDTSNERNNGNSGNGNGRDYGDDDDMDIDIMDRNDEVESRLGGGGAISGPKYGAGAGPSVDAVRDDSEVTLQDAKFMRMAGCRTLPSRDPLLAPEAIQWERRRDQSALRPSDWPATTLSTQATLYRGLDQVVGDEEVEVMEAAEAGPEDLVEVEVGAVQTEILSAGATPFLLESGGEERGYPTRLEEEEEGEAHGGRTTRRRSWRHSSSNSNKTGGCFPLSVRAMAMLMDVDMSPSMDVINRTRSSSRRCGVIQNSLHPPLLGTFAYLDQSSNQDSISKLEPYPKYNQSHRRGNSHHIISRDGNPLSVFHLHDHIN
ncbi:Histone deacetylase complex subunit [Zalerion maritima]|uniref:Histone deacetylase complex subunit n=1 Tax=Zalerion maritima TaxID=339359 RepID=A0AAD5S543_9PEZI|nr:Histone deacetylase complex subunit [Zalerion maritima]